MNQVKLLQLVSSLEAQELHVSLYEPLQSFIDSQGELNCETVGWSSIAKYSSGAVDLSGTGALSMSLASMVAVHQLYLKPNMALLDVCAAPGMKSLYAKFLEPSIDLCSNDLSFDRIQRMKRILEEHHIDSSISKYDSRFIDKSFEPESFDRILLDAPCSGEGVILGGDAKMLETWSPAKVKRLQQLQIKILKSSWKLLRPGGRLVYATCTLNKNENERVIKKALGLNVSVCIEPLSVNKLPILFSNQAWRILPSKTSIGFFIAVLEKNTEIE